MPATPELYQEVFQKITAETRGRLGKHARRRLAWLTTGIIGARSCVLAAVAKELYALGLTRASSAASVERTLRRILRDKRLTPTAAYEPVLRSAIDWFSRLWDQRYLVLIVDESSQDERLHLLRVSLAYWGGAQPLAWALWPQNQGQPAGAYWEHIDTVLARVAALLPRGLEVLVVADRAYDIPPFVDRIAAYGWHWLVRGKANGSLCFQDWRGRTEPLAQRLARAVGGPGQRWKARGKVFKEAGWREASVVAVWEPTAKEPLVTLSDRPPRWELHAGYDGRFWTEPGFRNDKSAGWRWEDSRVADLASQNVLLTAMAWATLVVLCLGRTAAAQQLAQQLRRAAKRGQRGRAPAHPQPARESLFTLGWQVAHRWLYCTVRVHLRWLLDELSPLSWTARWFQAQARLFIFFQTVRL
jgi:hypothetical protein